MHYKLLSIQWRGFSESCLLDHWIYILEEDGYFVTRPTDFASSRSSGRRIFPSVVTEEYHTILLGLFTPIGRFSDGGCLALNCILHEFS